MFIIHEVVSNNAVRRIFKRALHTSKSLQCWDTGNEALDYFQDNNPGAEKMEEGSNEAEWIVDLTTHADRDNKYALVH